MSIKKEKILLASQSPRRRALLNQIGLLHDNGKIDIDEHRIVESIVTSHEMTMPIAEKIVLEVAEAKAKAARLDKRYRDYPIIITADTIVYSDGKVLEKPASKAEAIAMLRFLSGKRHSVYTAVCISAANGSSDSFVSKTEVEFYALDETMEKIIQTYVATGSPLDKAGAYGIQDMGALLVKAIDGDVYNVIGLPVAELIRHLSLFDY